jgi:predicted RNA-binding protein (virulence factor B family)
MALSVVESSELSGVLIETGAEKDVLVVLHLFSLLLLDEVEIYWAVKIEPRPFLWNC